MIHKELNDLIIDAAVGNLTADQREYINKRDDTVRYYHDNNGPHEEGPSQPKGKGPDPLNWGGVNIDPGELNSEAQRRELEYFESQKKLKHASRDGPKKAQPLIQDPEGAAEESSEPNRQSEKSQKKRTRSQKIRSRKD
jgi:hypothetical protein